MEKLNIWLIQIGEILPLDEKQRKMRTAFLVDKLVERGHNVLWWTSAFDHFKKDWIFKKDTEVTLNSGLRLYALKGIGYKKNISLSRFIDHRIIAWKFKKIAPKMPKPDIIIASTPPYDLAYQAVKYAKRNKVSIIVDIRDEWPDLFLNFLPNNLRNITKILLFNEFKMIQEVMKSADALVSMMRSLLEWGLRYAGRFKKDADRVFYIGAQKMLFCESLLNPSFVNKLQNKFVVAYIGTFAKNNDPSILVDCAKKLMYNKDILFVLGGNGELFNPINKQASSLPNVIMTGWLNDVEIAFILRHSHIGVIPTPFYRDTFPNKFFIYLSYGLPIFFISPFQGELKELIEKYQIGFYYPPNDVDALANCILKLYNNPQLYKTMSENAKKIFDEMFDADKIYEEYAEHIEKVYVNYKK
jgi:glycosyltransferase involved in cell wall biosynthesis